MNLTVLINTLIYERRLKNSFHIFSKTACKFFLYAYFYIEVSI